LNVSFHPEDLAEFISSSGDPVLSKWDVVIPQGGGKAHALNAALSIRLQRRKLAVNIERREILVNEKKMRVGSRGVEKEGLDAEQITAAEIAYRNDPENAANANVPDWAYRAFRSRPLLVLHFLEGETQDQPFSVPPSSALTALGLSFPSIAGGSSRVTYRINLVEIRNLLAHEASEVEAEELDDDDDSA
jgi:hypothetical protein